MPNTAHPITDLKLPDPAPIIAFFDAGDDFIITSHINSDGDGIGASLACARVLRSQGKQCRIVLQDIPEEPLEFLEGWQDLQEASESPDHQAPYAIVLDCPSLDRIGRVQSYLSDDTRILNIDHHRDNAEFGALNVVTEEVCSSCELLFHIFSGMDVPFDRELSELLYTGIIYDTGAFRYSLTTPTSLEVAAELVRLGARLDYLSDQLYNRCTLPSVKLIGKAIDSLELHAQGQIAILYLAQADLQSGDPDETVNYGLMVKGVEAVALLREEKSDYHRVSLRSRDAVDVREVAAVFGGGGHTRAAGCRIEGNREQVQTALLEQLEKAIR